MSYLESHVTFWVNEVYDTLHKRYDVRKQWSSCLRQGWWDGREKLLSYGDFPGPQRNRGPRGIFYLYLLFLFYFALLTLLGWLGLLVLLLSHLLLALLFVFFTAFVSHFQLLC